MLNRKKLNKKGLSTAVKIIATVILVLILAVILSHLTSAFGTEGQNTSDKTKGTIQDMIKVITGLGESDEKMVLQLPGITKEGGWMAAGRDYTIQANIPMGYKRNVETKPLIFEIEGVYQVYKVDSTWHLLTLLDSTSSFGVEVKDRLGNPGSEIRIDDLNVANTGIIGSLKLTGSIIGYKPGFGAILIYYSVKQCTESSCATTQNVLDTSTQLIFAGGKEENSVPRVYETYKERSGGSSLVLSICEPVCSGSYTFCAECCKVGSEKAQCHSVLCSVINKCSYYKNSFFNHNSVDNGCNTLELVQKECESGAISERKGCSITCEIPYRDEAGNMMSPDKLKNKDCLDKFKEGISSSTVIDPTPTDSNSIKSKCSL